MCVVLRIVNGLILRLSSSYVHFLIGLMGVFTRLSFLDFLELCSLRSP